MIIVLQLSCYRHRDTAFCMVFLQALTKQNQLYGDNFGEALWEAKAIAVIACINDSEVCLLIACINDSDVYLLIIFINHKLDDKAISLYNMLD